MIRFIDLGKQTWGIYEGEPPTTADEECGFARQFAWFDTVTDSFLSFDGDWVFEDWEEFERSFAGSDYDYRREEVLAAFRFAGLCHDWVPCCHRDTDKDGNCHIHSSRGVLRVGPSRD